MCHIEVMGHGPAVVLLHGWSMHSGVWHAFAKQLAQFYQVYLVDLPGHGYSEWQEEGLTLDKWLPNLMPQLPEVAAYLGWSLGGNIALAIAHRYPARVRCISLIASNPCFVKQADWSVAVDEAVFEDFHRDLLVDSVSTLKRFVLLQLAGSQQGRRHIATISKQLQCRPVAQLAALQAGLVGLITWDMRQILQSLSCPRLLLLGQHDKLVPVALAKEITGWQSRIEVNVIDGAGHMPFISHPNESLRVLNHWLKRKNER